MLQTTHLQTAVDLPPSDGGGAGDFVDLALGFLRRRYLIILFLMLLGGVAGAIFLTVRPPTYIAQAKILIGTQKPQFVQQQSLTPDAPLDQAQMETQFQILQSKAILAPVVQKLNLADDPEFGSPPFQLRHVVKAILASVVQKLNLADDPEFGSPPVGLRRVFQVFINPTSAEPELDATETAIAALADRLTINRVG